MSDLNTDGSFTPKRIQSIDWGEAWKCLQDSRHVADSPDEWNARASEFGAHSLMSPYAKQFLALSQLRPNETVFDMGCGAGALSIPLGLAGHKVVAADFSQGMLDQLSKSLEENAIKTVFPKLMSWEEDWAAKGVREGMVDVCIASRSIGTYDLKDSLLRLSTIARRRVCITLPTTCSPRVDERLLRDMGITQEFPREHMYALNILAQEGIRAQLSYIQSPRLDSYESKEDAYEHLTRMIDGALFDATTDEREDAYQKLNVWLDSNLVPNANAGKLDKFAKPQKAFSLKHPRIITWAFIAWDKE